jgi:thioredoxin 1
MAASTSPITPLTSTSFEDAVSGPGLAVVDFWASWCGPCRAMAPQFERAARMRPKHRFGKVDVDAEPALAGKFGIRSIPTLAFFKDGELLGLAPGVVGADDLVKALDGLEG